MGKGYPKGHKRGQFAGGGTIGGGVPDYIEIQHTNPADNLALTQSNQVYEWSDVLVDTGGADLWTFTNNVLEVVLAGTYRISMKVTWVSSGGNSRYIAFIEREPAGGGGFVFLPLSTVFDDAVASNAQGSGSFTAILSAGDKLRVVTRILTTVTGSPTTQGENGSMWRIEKVA